MSYYDDIIFLNCAEFPEYRSCVNIKPLLQPQWEFALHTGGTLILNTKRQKQPLSFSSPVLFWRSFQQYCYHGVEQGQNRGHIYLVMSGSRAERAFEHVSGLFPAGYLPLDKDPAEFEAILNRMRGVLNAVWFRDEQHHPAAVAAFETLIAQLTQIHFLRQGGVRENSRISQLADRIRSNPMHPYDFESEVAPELGMSYNSFRALFRKVNGIGPWQFVMKCRLHYAMELLNSTELQVKEIADCCGFENSVSFFRFFRKNMGMTPLEYRKHLHSDYLG